MTNKEAISILKSSLNEHQYVFEHMWTNEQMKEAVDLAIKALEEKDNKKSCDNCRRFFDMEDYICLRCVYDTMKYFSQWEKKEADNETDN